MRTEQKNGSTNIPRPEQVILSPQQLEKLRRNQTLQLEQRQYPITDEIFVCSQKNVLHKFEIASADSPRRKQIRNEAGKVLTDFQYTDITTLKAHDPQNEFYLYQVILAQKGATWNILQWDGANQKFNEVGENYHHITLHPEYGYRLIGQTGAVMSFIDPSTGKSIRRTEINLYLHYDYDLSDDEIHVSYRTGHKESIPLLAIPPVESLILYPEEKKTHQSVWQKIKKKWTNLD
ncbi:MAG: hypothetical protein ABI425_06105 [Patescibacteria group bacterium]